jgi:hypothetical protein
MHVGTDITYYAFLAHLIGSNAAFSALALNTFGGIGSTGLLMKWTSPPIRGGRICRGLGLRRLRQ